MAFDDVGPLREILQRALARYLTVKPAGFQLVDGGRLHEQIDARILGFGGARTLYRNHKPACRSLDGIRPLYDERLTCADCRSHAGCTPQVRVDLMVDGRPFRLLLAHTSAKNFLAYGALLRQRAGSLERVVHRLRIVDRGTWGEIRFTTWD